MSLLRLISRAAGFTLLVALAASPTHATGTLNLRLNDCGAGAGLHTVPSACNYYGGTWRLIGSVVPDAPLTGLSGIGYKLDITSTQATMPPWWQFQAGGCRQSLISSQGDMDNTSCPSLWTSLPPFGSISVRTLTAPNRLHVEALFAVTTGSEGDVPGDGTTEFSAFVLNIPTVKTTGTGSCPGCNIGARIELTEVDLYLAGQASPIVLTPGAGGENVVTFLQTSSTSLAASPNPALPGQAVSLTAQVTPASATGRVTFREGTTVLDSVSLAGGSATLSLSAPATGEHDYSATYGGDADNASSSAGVHLTVSLPPSTTSLSSTPNPSYPAQSVQLTATLAPGDATGSVTFRDGPAELCTVPLASGTAACVTASLALGPHDLTATYAGDPSHYLGSSSDHVAQSVVLSPAPHLVSVHDVAGDQGGLVKVNWDASYYDLAPYYTIDSYWVLRSVPAAVALARIARGDLQLRLGTAGSPARAGAILASGVGDSTRYWEFDGSQPAFHVQHYSFAAATTGDSTAEANPRTYFMVQARTAGGADWWFSDPDSGYSVDNVPPASPQGFAATYQSGVAHLAWLANPDPDLAKYLLYRGDTPAFAPSEANLIAQLVSTDYTDPLGHAAAYKLAALDTHGNESPVVLAQPDAAGGVGPANLSLALAGMRPNPAVGTALAIGFTLPSDSPATLELLDVSGRRVAARDVGSLGAGTHTLRLGEGTRLPAGVYLVRLSQGGQSRVQRIAVLE